MGCASTKPTTVVTKQYPMQVHNRPVFVQQAPVVVSQMQPVQMVNLNHPQQPPSININVNQNQSGPAPPKTNSGEVIITQSMIDDFQALNVVILDLEKKNIMARLNDLGLKQTDLQREIESLNQQYQQLGAKTQKEFSDVSNLKAMAESASVLNYFQSQHDFESQLSTEEQEFVQAKGELEQCYKRLTDLQEENSRLSAEIEEINRSKNELLGLYGKQDQFLESIFGGLYGSSKEDELESSFDQLQEKQQKIETALRNWKNGESLAKASTSQLEFACRRWPDIGRIPYTGMHQITRIQAVTEVRNYLNAASKNLMNAQRYISPVKPPYCDEKEIKTLNTAIAHIYTDGMSRERHDYADKVYRTTYARCAMLLRWMSNVIENKIKQDLLEVRMKCGEARQALRMERLRLMKEKAEEQSGQIIHFSEGGAQADQESGESENVAQAAEVEKNGNKDLDEKIKQAKQDGEGEDETGDKELKVPLDELAPPPSRNELFGDLDSLIEQHNKQKEALQYEQDVAKARQEANFQERLQRRRSRKMRLEAQLE